MNTEYDGAVPENSSEDVSRTENDKSTSPGTLNNNSDWSNIDLAKKTQRGIQNNHTARLQRRTGHSTRSTKQLATLGTLHICLTLTDT